MVYRTALSFPHLAQKEKETYTHRGYTNIPSVTARQIIRFGMCYMAADGVSKLVVGEHQSAPGCYNRAICNPFVPTIHN